MSRDPHVGRAREAVANAGERVISGVESIMDRHGISHGNGPMVLLLMCVLALDSADKGAIGALAVPLKHDLGIGNTELGLLVTASSVIGLLAALPAGVLMDRTNRMRVLAVSVALWAVATAVAAQAQSFEFLLVSRMALGFVAGASGPGVASLIGDSFKDSERSAVYGEVLTGELIGAGFGLLFASEVAALLSWRWSLRLLALPALAVAGLLWRHPEPARKRSGDDAVSQARTRMPIVKTVKAVLSVRTNVLLIAASVSAYFFLAGLRTFAVVFARGRFGLSQSEVTGVVPIIGIGLLTGTFLGGRIADSLIRRGNQTGRILVGAVGPIVAAALILPGLLVRSLVPALALFTLAGAALGAAMPATDAARLDVMPSEMWGRAEAVRTALRTGGEAIAPLLFGLLSTALAAPGHGPKGSHARGLQLAFLVMLAPLLASGLIQWRARRTYVADAEAASSVGVQPKDELTV